MKLQRRIYELNWAYICLLALSPRKLKYRPIMSQRERINMAIERFAWRRLRNKNINGDSILQAQNVTKGRTDVSETGMEQRSH